MKKTFTLFAAVLITAVLFAQAPDKMSYQAVIRDASGNLITEKEVGMQISILQGSASGTAVYVETQTPTTNANGLVSVEIGAGTVVSGDFATIDWSNGPYFIKTETDSSGGTDYTITGTSQLLSVPYALHARTTDQPGPQGETGPPGADGSDGLSAYEVWLELGNEGTEEEFIASLIGPTGSQGPAGPAGADGQDGQDGATSVAELSDVDLTDIAAGKILKYDAGEVMWIIGDDLGITLETDPVFEASPAAGIVAADIGNWDEAYLWGDHAGEGYLTEETDPVFTAWDRSTGIEITESQISDLQSYYLASNPDGFITNYIVTEEDVTTYESALSISESQITDLKSYLLDISNERIGYLSDVDLTGIGAGKVLKYDAGNGVWVVADDLGITEETDPSVPTGTQTGEMQYWNGSEWITVSPGTDGQVLTFSNGVPAWSTTVGWNDLQNPATGKIWMDRNLGASQVATSSDDAAAYGDLYQWGRDADGHQIRTSATTEELSESDTPGHGDFILAPDSPYDWRSPQNDNLWQGVSGTNNPCPGGYRLPTEAEWEAERQNWSSNDDAGAFKSPLKLPVAGLRFGNSDGSLYDVGWGGYYWSSTVAGTYSRYLAFYSSDASMGSYYRAIGSSVRCLKD